MSLTRWLNPARWLRPAGVGTAAEGSPAKGEASAAMDVTLASIEPPAEPPPRVAEAADVAAVSPPASEALAIRVVGWMLGLPAVATLEKPPPASIGRLFEKLDAVIASDTLRAALLPRAPHVVPRLMKTLRDESYSSADVASRISQDVVLTTEVIRSATSAFQRGEDDGEVDLAWAVAAIGTEGLRRAIASVVLRPIFDARGDTLSSRAAAQIWKDADKKARLCGVLAAERSLDPFDGYLAGLLHNTGWTALLRALDGFQDFRVDAAHLAHPDVVLPLLRRRDALFGALVEPWNLSPAVNALAAEVGSGGLGAVQSPLGVSLREAERLSALHDLAPAGQRPATAVPDWATLPRQVQDCYANLSRPAPP